MSHWLADVSNGVLTDDSLSVCLRRRPEQHAAASHKQVGYNSCRLHHAKVCFRCAQFYAGDTGTMACVQHLKALQ